MHIKYRLTYEKEKQANLVKPPRGSNFELMRILMMLMIVAYHLLCYGIAPDVAASPLLSKIVVATFCSGGKIGVNGFVLLSGYFLCVSASSAKPKRLLKLYLQMFFYSMGTFLVMAALGICRFNLDDVVAFIFPIGRSTYPFATNFFFLMLLSPFINLLIKALDRKNYLRLLAVSFVIFSLIPTIIEVRYPYENLVWFVFLYLLAGFVRLYPMPLFDRKWLALGVAAGCYCIIAGYRAMLGALLPHIPILRFIPPAMTSRSNAVPVLLCALGLLLFFKNVKVKGSRIINLIASATFGVYLLHDHSKAMRQLLWKDLFDCRPFLSDTAALTWRILAAVAAVFAVGIVIDLIRQYALEKPLFLWINKIKWTPKKSGESG